MKIDKDIVNILADALLSTGSARPPEPPQKWYVCISDGKGGYKRHETQSLYQAETVLQDWLTTGWCAWIQDAEGRDLVIAKRPLGIN